MSQPSHTRETQTTKVPSTTKVPQPASVALVSVLAIGWLSCATAEVDPTDGLGSSDDGCPVSAASTDADPCDVARDDLRPQDAAPDASGADTSSCACSVGMRRCRGAAHVETCGEDCRWHEAACDSGRCADGVCCECSAGPAQCTLDNTAVRSCSDGCTWEVTLCISGCLDSECCEPCAPELGRCLAALVYEYCHSGCLVRVDCVTDGYNCAEDYPHAPYTHCVQWPEEGYPSGCQCQACRNDQDCDSVHKLGPSCEKHNYFNYCVCQGNADCLGRTAGPRCLNSLCGCAGPDDCPSGEQCVRGNAASPVQGHRVCSGNAIWPQ